MGDVAGIPPPFVLTCGLPGSGKTTLAEALAERLGAVRHSSDAIRAELGLRGDYGPEAIDRVYQVLVERAERSARGGRAVVLDATFSSRRQRARATRAGARLGRPATVVLLVADEPVSLARVGTERADSEAGQAAYELLRSRFDAVDGEHLVLDTSRSTVESLLAEVERHLRGSGP